LHEIKTMLSGSRAHRFILLLLFLVYFVNGVISIRSNSIVSDETDHLSYGIRVLSGKPQKVYEDDASTQPVSALNALPRAVEQVLNPGLQKEDGGVSDTKNGRYISLFICALIGIYVYKWSSELYGENAGLFSLFLFTFCPNLQANIPLVGTDAYAVLFTITSAWYFRRLILYPTWRTHILFSLQIGLALVTKQSLFLLPLIYGIIALGILFKRRNLKKNIGINFARLGVLTLIVLLVINAAFLFQGTGKSLAQYEFKSETFQSFQQGFLSKVPVPLPAPFLEGYDGVKYMLSLGSGHGNVSGRSYLFGEYFTGNSKWYYYSALILFKTPLSVLILLILVLAALFRKPFSRQRLIDAGYPLGLAFFFLVFISLTNTSQHSLRHLLMIFPLFYISMGQVVNWKVRRKKLMLAVIILYGLFGFYRYFPNLISYTNELIWNKTNAYRVLASSNIDHFQARHSLEKYLQNHPDVKIPGEKPDAGEFIVGINEYLDLKQEKKHDWLNNFAPYGHVNHCYLLFRITEQDLANKNLINVER